jgi:pimeloyl-ACP methyl ester carboxylesterase
VEAVVAGATLSYEQTGAGPDIVWLAAGDHPGSNWRRFQTPAFEPGLRNTTYDARGVGATVTEDPPPWPIATHARDCAALIEAVCAPPVFLVGLSMGSLIATELACTRPDLVRAALVMGTYVRKTGFIREWQACLDYDSSDLLPRCEVPIHAIASSHDVQTPPARVREVAELAPRGSFHLLEGLGHGSAFGHRPDVVNACLRDIIEAELGRAPAPATRSAPPASGRSPRRAGL